MSFIDIAVNDLLRWGREWPAAHEIGRAEFQRATRDEIKWYLYGLRVPYDEELALRIAARLWERLLRSD